MADPKCLLDSGDRRNTTLPEFTSALHEDQSVVVVGGTAAVPESKLKGITVAERVWGEDPLETMRAVVAWADRHTAEQAEVEANTDPLPEPPKRTVKIGNKAVHGLKMQGDKVFVDGLRIGYAGLGVEIDAFERHCTPATGQQFVGDTLRTVRHFASKGAETIVDLVADMQEEFADYKIRQQGRGRGAVLDSDLRFLTYQRDLAVLRAASAARRGWISQQQQRRDILNLAAACAERLGDSKAQHDLVRRSAELGFEMLEWDGLPDGLG